MAHFVEELRLEAERAILAMQTAALAARQLHARAELMRHMLTTARKVADKPKAEAVETVVREWMEAWNLRRGDWPHIAREMEAFTAAFHDYANEPGDANDAALRRACDALVDRFVTTQPDDATRTLLRLGTYQLAFGRVPPHAAVGETVGLAPKRTRGFVNAVLRRVADAPHVFASDAARLSYPDWIVDRLVAELGPRDAIASLEAMNAAPHATVRPDGYVQDLSSQWVASAVGAAAETASAIGSGRRGDDLAAVGQRSPSRCLGGAPHGARGDQRDGEHHRGEEPPRSRLLE